MALAQFPVASTVVTSLNTSYLTTTATSTGYWSTVSFDPATFAVSCSPATSVATLTFSNANGILGTTVTSGGTSTFNLSTAATVLTWSVTGNANTTITLTKNGNALTALPSGSLETITTSGTYTYSSTSGLGYVTVVGGGGSGGFGQGSYSRTGGGGSGGIQTTIISLSSPLVITIGEIGRAHV